MSEAEFLDILENVSFVRMMKAIEIDIDELPDIFEVLNDGTGGAIAMDAFITGIMRLQGPSMSRDMLKGSARIGNLLIYISIYLSIYLLYRSIYLLYRSIYLSIYLSAARQVQRGLRGRGRDRVQELRQDPYGDLAIISPTIVS